MKNRLISEEFRKEGLLRDPDGFDETRASGKTTGRALYFLGLAMSNPDKDYRLTDHYCGQGMDEYTISENVAIVTQDLIDRLGLKFLEIRKVNRGNIDAGFYIKYKVFSY